MTTLHWRIIGLFVWTTFFFSIDLLRPLVGQDAPLQTVVLTMTGMFALILPLIPQFQQRSFPTIATLVGVLYIGVIFISGTNPFERSELLQQILSVGLLLITTALSHQVARSLLEFRNAIETITFSNVDGYVRNREEIQKAVDTEMARSRRFERPLSLVMIKADASSINMQMHRIVQEIQRGMMQRYVLSTMIHVLSRTLRRTDLVVEDNRTGQLLVVAPETDAAEAELMGARITRIIQMRLGINARYGVSAFPNQALTFEDMRDLAEKDLHRDQPPAEHNPEMLEIVDRPAVDVPSNK